MTSELSLHRAVFEGDYDQVEKIVKTLKDNEINRQDSHGNTALHIAVAKANKRCVELLIKSGAKTTIPNEQNWRPLQEAISYGDFEMSKMLAENELVTAAKFLDTNKLLELLNMSEHNYVLTLEIRRKDFKPTLGPIPTQGELQMTVFKKANRARFDLRVTDAFQSQPTYLSVVFDFTDNAFKLILRNAPVYQSIPLNSLQQIIEDFIKNEMIGSIVAEAMKKENVTKSLQTDSDSASYPFQKVFTKKVAGFATDIYESKGIDMIRKVRSEHMTARTEANNPNELSLPPPEPRNVSWDEYVNAPKGLFPYLGRKPIETIHTNRITIVVGISKEVALRFKWDWIVECATGLLDYKISQQIIDQIKSLPEGFPTYIDFPMHRSNDHVKWKLISFEIVDDLTDTLFTVPQGFQEMEIIPHSRQSSSETQTLRSDSL